MQYINVAEMNKEQIKEHLVRPAFDSVELPEEVKQGITKIFGEQLDALAVVQKIVTDVRCEGDNKLLYYTEKIDRVKLTRQSMFVSKAEFAEAEGIVDKKVVESLRKSIDNVKKFHEEQLPKSWLTFRELGCIMGQKVTPLDCVGIYVPGGTAAYPSSVIMNAVPAKVAGVKEIVMCVPPGEGGKINPYVLIAANLVGVDKVFKAGGAQAIAAMAFGTDMVPKVDKITGPGNIFVTLAKKEVYGHCDIDMLAGPSEILVIADENADASYIAADLLSQAEHDPLASCVLVTNSSIILSAVKEQISEQIEKLPRKKLAKASIDKQCKLIVTKDLLQAAEVANICAPEHLEVLVKEPFNLLPYLKHAGAIFLGAYSPEPLGDYYAGPNHVLPTGGTARFYSVLNVETFMKKTSIISYSEKALLAAGADVIRLAEAEGLDAHANSVRLRMQKEQQNA